MSFHDVIIFLMAVLGAYLTLFPIMTKVKKIVFLATFAVLGFGGIVVSHLERKEANKTHEKELEEQRNKIDDLLRSNKRLEEKIAPVLAIAMQRFPNLPPSEALEKLQKEIQNLETRTSTLERKTTFRTLTPVQREQLIDSLLSYKGHKIMIHAIMGDIETKQFAEVFKEIFQKAGWLVDGVYTMVYEPSPVGINIYIGKLPSNDGQKINDALRAIGLQFEARIDPAIKSDDVILTIGPKRLE